MNRQKAIQRIIWSLLAHASVPQKAVAAALTAKPDLGSRADADFRNLLRAAGLFARDDDGFFVRYLRRIPTHTGNGSPSLPLPTHLLTVPVPVEPRMRIAYSVFTGLLLKHLFQRHAVVPLQVSEGMALLWDPGQPPAPASPLPNDAEQVWHGFQSSNLAESALQDGIEATFLGLRGGRPIGALKVPFSWKGTHIEVLLRKSVERNPRLFQAQSKEDKIQFASKPKMPATVTPLSVLAINSTELSATGTAITSGNRCLVCGSAGDMIEGGKFFLPENKKQWYEEPGPRDKFPKLCAACAYIALLSGISPSPDQSILEFPSDNFLELFALQGQLQGLSGTVALKGINRVATLAVLPSRYLVLSIKPKPRNPNAASPMDSKAQVYSQLRHHTALLSLAPKRPFRLYLAGQGLSTLLESEFHPHVAIGLSHFRALPRWTVTKGEQKALMHRTTSLMLDGRPFAALYLAAQSEQPPQGFGYERRVLVKGLRLFEAAFVKNVFYSAKLAQALGGDAMKPQVYNDVIEFSNFLLDLVRPLVQREVDGNRTSVSGVARKYTDLITRDFTECRAAKFLYVVAQELDSAEKDPTTDKWRFLKWQAMEKLYGESPSVKGKSGEEAAKLWAEFRERHQETVLEKNIRELNAKYAIDTGLWPKFLGEVQARTLALLMLNVRNPSNR